MPIIEIASIAIMCYIIGQLLKATPIATKWIPVLVPIAGAILGGVGMAIGVPLLVEMHLYDALAAGAMSGIMSCGIFSAYKNVSGDYDENNFSKKLQIPKEYVR